MILVQSSDNPMPPDPICGFIDVDTETKLRFSRWKTKKNPARGTLILLHGRTEYIEKMFETIADMQKWGFDIVTFDWRNQGGSSKKPDDTLRGHIENFGQYVSDLDAIMKQIVLPDCPTPFHIISHSMGSLVALLAVSRSDNHICRMALCSPLLKLGSSLPPQNLIKYPVCFLKTIGLGKMPVRKKRQLRNSQKLDENKLTSDANRLRRNKNFTQSNPGLAIGHPTIAWLHAAIKAMETVTRPEYYNQIVTSILLVNAGDDKVVNPQVAEALGRALPSGSTLTINRAHHELMQERDIFRNQALSAIEAFICKK